MNTKKRVNTINALPIFKWMMIACSLGGIGLQIVHLKNKQFQLGQNIWQLEHTLRETHTRNQVLLAEIATLSSRAAIQKKLKSMAVVMHAIKDQCIARVLILKISEEDEVRTACNERSRQ